MAPGRTLATMFLTAASDADITADTGRPVSFSRSAALMMTPDDAVNRGTVAYLPSDTTPLVDDVATVDDSWSRSSGDVQRDNDGGHSDREPARQ